MGSVNLGSYRSVYVDTSIYIYFFEDSPQYGSIAEEIFSQIIDKQILVVVSEIVFTELLVKPTRIKAEHLIDLYQNLNTVIPTLRPTPVTHDIALTAANLRAKYGLRTPDAIHLATAIDEQADIFVHSDKLFSKAKEVRTLDISRYLVSPPSP